MADDSNEPNDAGTETQRGTEARSETQSRIPQEPRGHVIDDISVLSNENSFAGTSVSSVTAPSPSNVQSGGNALNNKQMLSFADIIAESFVRATQNAKSNQPASFPLQNPPQQLGVTGLTLSSGLEVLHVPRSGKQQATAGIMSKHSRGDTESARLKRKKAVTAAMSDKLACNNVLSLISADDVEKHNLAADCQQWQIGLRSFKKVLTENDMLTPYLIPETFDLDDPTLTKGPFTNLIDDFHAVSDEKAQLWQKYLHKYAAFVELESAAWAVEVMEKSMTAELKALVFDDLQDLEPTASGAITMFKIATNHMVLRNQETIDALQEWIRTFDIRKIPGENISVACTQCRAVIRALESFGLPANALRCLLDGFAHASNETFKQLCMTLSTMNRSVLMRNQFVDKSVKQKCFDVLKDLEATYIDLSTGHKWNGAGDNGSAFLTQYADETAEAHALAARNLIPFDEWVKTAECRICKKKGHIAPKCPDRDTTRGNGRQNDQRGGGNNDRRSDGNQRGRGNQRDHRSQKTREDRRFKKAYKAAIETFARDSSSDEESDTSASPKANVAETANDSDGSDSVGSLAAHAARMYSSLKE